MYLFCNELKCICSNKSKCICFSVPPRVVARKEGEVQARAGEKAELECVAHGELYDGDLYDDNHNHNACHHGELQHHQDDVYDDDHDDNHDHGHDDNHNHDNSHDGEHTDNDDNHDDGDDDKNSEVAYWYRLHSGNPHDDNHNDDHDDDHDGGGGVDSRFHQEQ